MPLFEHRWKFSRVIRRFSHNPFAADILNLMAVILLLFGSKASALADSSKPYGKVHVIAVGVGKYSNAESLAYPENDARQVAEVLEKKYGFASPVILINSDATKERIFAEIDKVRGKLSPDRKDDFVFYFSGHGMTGLEIKAEAGSTNSVRHGFILPHAPRVSGWSARDLPALWANAVSLKELMESVSALRDARHRIVILDSCFSGLVFRGQQAFVGVPEDAYEKVIEKPSVQVLTAGLESESALEDGKLQHGVFTDALLKHLRDPKVRTMEELFLPLRVDVREYFASRKMPRTMNPQHRYVVYDRGTFVFVPPDRYETWAKSSPVLTASISGVKLRGADVENPVTMEELRKVKYHRFEMSDEELLLKKERFEHRASTGDGLAAYGISEMYKRGIGVPKDDARSTLWSKEAFDAGNSGDADKNLQIALTIVQMMGGGGGLGGASPGGIAAMTALFDQNSAESFKKVATDVSKLARERKRGEALKKFPELRKLIDEMVTETNGKAPKEQIADLKQLTDLVESELKFGLYDSAAEEMGESNGILVPIAREIPAKGKKGIFP